ACATRFTLRNCGLCLNALQSVQVPPERRHRSMSYGTLPSKMLHAVDTWPSPRAQMFRTPSGWQNISSEEFLRRTAGLAQAFFELGVKPGDRVGLFCGNRPEWHTADFAINGNGALSVLVC